MRRGRLAAVLVAFAASAGTFAASASATSPDAGLQRSCTALLGAVQRVVLHASTTHVATITGHFEAITPGRLTGVISFDRTGTTISVAADPSTASQGCAAGSTGPGVPKSRGRSRIVSTLHRKFATAGRHTLTFQLNKTGQAMLTRVGAGDRAYRKRHPHGFRAPSMAFGVSLSYAAAG
jgi:hypothetical protein